MQYATLPPRGSYCQRYSWHVCSMRHYHQEGLQEIKGGTLGFPSVIKKIISLYQEAWRSWQKNAATARSRTCAAKLLQVVAQGSGLWIDHNQTPVKTVLHFISQFYFKTSENLCSFCLACWFSQRIVQTLLFHFFFTRAALSWYLLDLSRRFRKTICFFERFLALGHLDFWVPRLLYIFTWPWLFFETCANSVSCLLATLAACSKCSLPFSHQDIPSNSALQPWEQVAVHCLTWTSWNSYPASFVSWLNWQPSSVAPVSLSSSSQASLYHLQRPWHPWL